MSAAGRVHSRVRTGRSPPRPVPTFAYFFDIDGTLAEIAASPDRAMVDPSLRDRIATLHHDTGGAVALISGRTIADVDALFPGVRYPVAGQHGAERRTALGAAVRHAFAIAPIRKFRDRMRNAVARHAGVAVEDKGFSLAVHYRGAQRLAGFVNRTARAIAAECGPGLTVLRGKRVVEVLPAGHDKGRAVVAFLAEKPFRGRRPVFIGDDITDESAFAIVNGLDGISVKVGPGPTRARWRLNGVADVQRWLEEVA